MIPNLPQPDPEITITYLTFCPVRIIANRDFICRIINRMLSAIPVPVIKNVEYYILNDAQIMELNRRYLGILGPTNILSFPDPESESGSLYLSWVTFERECVLYRLAPADYFKRLTAHGLAHLHGLEHGNELWNMEASFLKKAELVRPLL